MKTKLIAFLVLCPILALAYPDLPDPAMTPGHAATSDVETICQKSYSLHARNVSTSTKAKVYRQYGVDKTRCEGGCKIDHLIPLAIGGSNDRSNLWPHEIGIEWGAHRKTRLEVRLRKEVCAGRMDVLVAQHCIKSNWKQCYASFYGENDK